MWLLDHLFISCLLEHYQYQMFSQTQSYHHNFLDKYHGTTRRPKFPHHSLPDSHPNRAPVLPYLLLFHTPPEISNASTVPLVLGGYNQHNAMFLWHFFFFWMIFTVTFFNCNLIFFWGTTHRKKNFHMEAVLSFTYSVSLSPKIDVYLASHFFSSHFISIIP